MNFVKLFQKSNSSILQLQGNVLKCIIEQKQGNKIIIDTGMRPPFVCLQNELSAAKTVLNSVETRYAYFLNGKHKLYFRLQAKVSSETSSLSSLKTTIIFPLKSPLSHLLYKNKNVALTSEWCTASCKTSPVVNNLGLLRKNGSKLKLFIGVENVTDSKSCGELTCIAPKSFDQLSKRKFVWNELTNLWRSGTKNRVKGFILNSVNGGFAVAIAGYIAFMPKSLCINKIVFFGQWREFAIIGMNPKLANIVVKEVRAHTNTKFEQQSASRRRRRRRSTLL